MERRMQACARLFTPDTAFMNETVSLYYSKISDYIKRLDKKKRNLYLTIFGLCFAAAIIFALIINHKEYVVLYKNLDTKECATIVQKLDEMSVDSKVENESTIYVEKKEEPKVKLQLASEGLPKSALNYDIFTSNIDFMTTDYEKTKFNLFQLQERLQASIKTLEIINDAIVTITIPDNSLSVLDEDRIEPSASVLLKVMSGVTLSGQQIKGIEQLVAKSVPGLKPESISIVDQTGVILNDNSDETLLTTASRISAEKEISNIFSSRILNVLAPIYGKDNISIGVNVSLDYNKKITEKTEYSPSKDNAGVINGYDQTYEGTGGAQANGGVPGIEQNTEVPGYETPTGTGADGTISNQVSVDYVVSQIKEQIQKEGAEIKDVTVSVLLDKKDMAEEEIAKVTAIIANTSGIDIDKVELFHTDFTAANAIEESNKTPFSQSSILKSFFSPIYLTLFAIIVSLLIILFIVIIRKPRSKKRELLHKIVSEEERMQKEAEVKENSIDITKITETKEQQLAKEIRDFSMKTPQITAMLLKTLLKGDAD